MELQQREPHDCKRSSFSRSEDICLLNNRFLHCFGMSETKIFVIDKTCIHDNKDNVNKDKSIDMDCKRSKGTNQCKSKKRLFHGNRYLIKQGTDFTSASTAKKWRDTRQIVEISITALRRHYLRLRKIYFMTSESINIKFHLVIYVKVKT